MYRDMTVENSISAVAHFADDDIDIRPIIDQFEEGVETRLLTFDEVVDRYVEHGGSEVDFDLWYHQRLDNDTLKALRYEAESILNENIVDVRDYLEVNGYE